MLSSNLFTFLLKVGVNLETTALNDENLSMNDVEKRSSTITLKTNDVKKKLKTNEQSEIKLQQNLMNIQKKSIATGTGTASTKRPFYSS